MPFFVFPFKAMQVVHFNFLCQEVCLRQKWLIKGGYNYFISFCNICIRVILSLSYCLDCPLILMFKQNISRYHLLFSIYWIPCFGTVGTAHTIKWHLYIFWIQKKVQKCPVCGLNRGMNCEDLIKEVPNQHILSDLFHALQWKWKSENDRE